MQYAAFTNARLLKKAISGDRWCHFLIPLFRLLAIMFLLLYKRRLMIDQYREIQSLKYLSMGASHSIISLISRSFGKV